MALAQKDNFNHILTFGAIAMVAVHFAVVAMLGFSPPKWGAKGVADSTTITAAPTLAPKPNLPLSLTPPPPVDVVPSTKPITIKPIYLATLPDLTEDSAASRKEQFIAIMLPLILRANQELAQHRQQILEASQNNDTAALMRWGAIYGISENTASIEDSLTHRVAPVPVSIALAQAAVESGWGTSRFARHGNAIFGQWAWRPDAGLRPLEARYDNAVVRSFDSLFDSTTAYMHNLNSHFAYAEFRSLRHHLSQDGLDADDIAVLVNTLHRYSEEGTKYTQTLASVIRINGFVAYDDAVLLAE